MTGILPVAPNQYDRHNEQITRTLLEERLGVVENVGTLGTMATQNSNAVAITGGSITGITDLAVADGGTGASNAAGARTNLGLVIGTDVQAYAANLTSWAGIAPAAKLDANAVSAFGLTLIDDVDAAAARTTLGLGTIATQAANNVAITGGSIAGIADLAVADGGTGASDAAAARTNLGVGMALIASGTASGATLDIDLTAASGYAGILIKLHLLPATDGVDLYMRFSTNGGSTYDSGAGNYNYATTIVRSSGTSAVGASDAATEIRIFAAAVIGNGTTEGASVTIDLFNHTSTALWSRATWEGYAITDDATPQGRLINGGGAREAAQDTDAVRFLFSSGNIASGVYRVYGLS